jgi:type VI secretion system protein ImpE
MNPVFDAVRSGELDKALALSENGVRENPSCPLARGLLADILMIRGDFERAETHLGAVLRFDPSQQREIDSLMQLLRAECDRQQVFAEGRTPEFLTPPTESMKLRLGALANIRSGDAATAHGMLAEAQRIEPEYVAIANAGEPAPFLDWDARFGATLEALSATGKYYWIPLSSVLSIEFAPVRTLRDLAWRSAVVTLGDSARPPVADAGASANVAFVFLPTRYPGSETSTDGAVRAGGATEWTEPAPGVGIGVGQRVYLHGESPLAAVSLSHVAVASGDGVASGGAGKVGR